MSGGGRTGFAVVVALCLLLLSGCGFVMTDLEGLLEKPTLNARQAAVYRALADSLGSDDVVYRRPVRGEYRSSFLFYDMDGDGLDEAVVFYAFADEPGATRTKILREDGAGVWSSVQDVPVASEQIDFVRFSKLLSEDASCMLIGWQSSAAQSARGAESFFGVYSYADGAFRTEIDRQYYQEYAVGDFDGNSLDDIVTVGREGGPGYQVSLLRAVGRRIAKTASLPLSSGVESALRLSTGSLGYGCGAVYVDELLGADEGTGVSHHATEVVQVDRSGLTLLAGGEKPPENGEPQPAWTNYSFTFRDAGPGEEALFSEDIDGDGVIETPAISDELPGNPDDWGGAPVRLTTYLVFTRSGIDVKCNAVVNTAERYLLKYPDKWQSRVLVQEAEGPDEWRFYAIDTETGEPAIELLRILAYSSSVAGVEDPDEIALGSRGARHFTGYIPHTENDEPTAITEEELRGMFLLPAA